MLLEDFAVKEDLRFTSKNPYREVAGMIGRIGWKGWFIYLICRTDKITINLVAGC